MTKQQLRIFMSLLVLHQVTQTTNGVGRIFTGRGFLESVGVIYWTYQNLNPLIESKEVQDLREHLKLVKEF